MVRCLVVMLILIVAGTGAFFGWRSSHRTEADAVWAQADASIHSAIAMLPSRDK